MNKTIRIGIIGTGNICHWVHVPELEEIAEAKITALCDIDPKRRDILAARLGIPPERCFDDYNDLIACEEVDAVDICTPNNVHVEIALAAIKAGKPFAVEKPIAVTAEEARVLRDAQAAAKVPSMICFSYRFKNAARKAREIVQSGKLGTIRHVYVRYLQAWGNPELNVPCVWRFKEAVSGSGALGDLGSHMLDLVRFILGEGYIDITAKTGTFVKERCAVDDPNRMEKVDVDDYAHYFATTESGVATSFEISRNAYGRGNYQRIEIYGDKGAIEYSLENEDALSVCFHGEEEKKHRFDRIAVDKNGDTQMQSFINLIKGNGNPSCATIEDGYVNQIYLDAVKKSAAEGKAIAL